MSRSRRPAKLTKLTRPICSCWLCESSSTKRAVIQERVNARAAREPNESMADIKHQVDRGFCDEGCPHCDWICDHYCGCSENVANYQSKPKFMTLAHAMRAL